MSRFMTVPEVAKILGISGTNVLFYIAKGELQAFNSSMGTRRPRWKISQESLDAFIASRSSGKPDPRPRRRKAKASIIPQYV